jgi:nitroreductase/NAD-dependent dihydropyrimidine dehydrogenase PreA subunit
MKGAGEMSVKIDESKCDNCNLCYEVCIGGPIFEGPVVLDNRGFLCIECGHCYAVCPRKAITMEGFDDIETSELGKEPAVDGRSMMALLKGRRSGRLFKPGPVSREHILELIEAASTAPSAHNGRPVRAYAYRDEAVIEEIEKRTFAFYRRLLNIFGKPGFPLAWKLIGLDIKELEVLKHSFAGLLRPAKKDDILCYGSTTLLAFTAPKRSALAVGDAWIAAQNAVIQAEAVGVAAFYNGFIIMAAAGSRALRKVMGIPVGEKLVAVLTLGYPERRFSREAPRRNMPVNWK